NGLFPEWQYARHGVLQALSCWQLAFRDFGIALVEARMTLVIFRDWIGRNRIGTTPDQHLLVTELGGGFGLVQTLQIAIMTLVQAPVQAYRGIHGVHGIQRDPQSANGTLEYRAESQIKFITLCFQQFAGSTCLFATG